jgi:hypothetical protein
VNITNSRIEYGAVLKKGDFFAGFCYSLTDWGNWTKINRAVLSQTLENFSVSETETPPPKKNNFLLKLHLSRCACYFMWVRNLVLQVNDKYKIEGFGEGCWGAYLYLRKTKKWRMEKNHCEQLPILCSSPLIGYLDWHVVHTHCLQTNYGQYQKKSSTISSTLFAMYLSESTNHSTPYFLCN